ncbi:phosphonate metabolism protein PhnM [Sporolactobacillus terrae]|uniref:Phosphonate metabolism protein PhnM n=1 Tax=Sporolactobacillus terrae TaxID=269673 RepID=A0ABX5Q3V4_9BACL|nr:phosphonate metabolism protein PhnM [Sporolactobacillus terrae]QAA21320.1 phosphonate metabolism protein PhnM [Sporolactobacillus terrae]QAA24292.1 phosphonate metabolism protein PhnM [Sporolactobacillus terrae]UAK16096.1 phosphonate metabolism protein PhnM [Sporolactobacillus terrae]
MKIYHANIVLPNRVIENGSVTIEASRISRIEAGAPESVTASDLDAGGRWLIPGLIDSHSDAIEVEIEPRPTSRFAIELSFAELEKKLAAEGITTIFHAVSLMKQNTIRKARQNETVYALMDSIHRLAQGPHLIRHKTHLRFEIANIDAVEAVSALLRDGKIDEFSLTDHTPGQGQYRDLEVQRRLLIEHRHFSKKEAEQMIEDTKKQEKLDPQMLQQLAHLANTCGIPVASHDDDTIEKLDLIHSWQAEISEFPITLEAARYARKLGMRVVMGAPNLLLGKSHSNNLSALDAVREGLVDLFCSDYYPASLLHAAFKLHYDLGIDAPQAFNTVTLNPARALKLDHDIGSIESGKKADLLIVGVSETKQPLLQHVFVDGSEVCRMNYLTAHHQPALKR